MHVCVAKGRKRHARGIYPIPSSLLGAHAATHSHRELRAPSRPVVARVASACPRLSSSPPILPDEASSTLCVCIINVCVCVSRRAGSSSPAARRSRSHVRGEPPDGTHAFRPLATQHHSAGPRQTRQTDPTDRASESSTSCKNLARFACAAATPARTTGLSVFRLNNDKTILKQSVIVLLIFSLITTNEQILFFIKSVTLRFCFVLIGLRKTV